MVEQLNLTVLFWRNMEWSARGESFPDSSEEQAFADRCGVSCQLIGFRFCVEADAWKLVCSENNMNPDAMLRPLRGFETVRETEEAARELLSTPEELEDYLWEVGLEDIQVPTVEQAAQNMRDFLEKRARWWAGG